MSINDAEIPLQESFDTAAKIRKDIVDATQHYAATASNSHDSGATPNLIELYRTYAKNHEEHQQKFLTNANELLSKIQQNKGKNKILNNAEIIELHRNLGIDFDAYGNILKINNSSKLLPTIKQMLSRLQPPNQTTGYYQYLKSAGANIPDLDKLKNFNIDDPEHLILFAQPILHSPVITPSTIMQAIPKDNKKISTLIEELEEKLKLLSSKKQENQGGNLQEIRQDINNLFRNLYNHLGIKCYINNNNSIQLQKIKYNSPALFAESIKNNINTPTESYNRYSIHFNNENMYATRTTHVPSSNDSEPKKRIGSGGYGEVHRAIMYVPNTQQAVLQSKTQGTMEEVAIKKIRLPAQGQIDFQERMKAISNELRVLKMLAQAKGAKISIQKNNDNDFDIVMQLHPGRSLNKQDSNGLKFENKIQLAKKIIADIQLLHAKNIRHNDIKGENIIVDYENLNAKLIDFGISDPLNNSDTPNLQLQGTPIYMPPEIIKTDLIATSGQDPIPSQHLLATDVYSLGKVLIYDLGLNDLGIAYRMTNTVPTERPSLDECIKALNSYEEKRLYIQAKEQKIAKLSKHYSNKANPKILTDKTNLILELFKEQDICSQQYYPTLIQVLEFGSKEELEKLQQVSMFDHLFKMDPIALSKGIYTKQDIPFENKLLALFQHAEKNQNSQDMAFSLIDYLCKNLTTEKELWCTSNFIVTSLTSDPQTSEFVKTMLQQYLERQQLTPEITHKLNNIVIGLNSSNKNTDDDTYSSEGSVGNPSLS